MKVLTIVFVLSFAFTSADADDELRVTEGKIENTSLEPINHRIGETEFSGSWSSLATPDEKFTPIVFSSASIAFRPQVGVGYGPKAADERRAVRFFCKPFSGSPELPLQRRSIYYFHADGQKKGDVEKIGEFEGNDDESVIREKAIAALNQFIEQNALARPAANRESKKAR